MFRKEKNCLFPTLLLEKLIISCYIYFYITAKHKAKCCLFPVKMGLDGGQEF